MGKQRKVEILELKHDDKGFFQIEEAHLKYERFDGSMSNELVRLNLRRGDAVAAVVHNRLNDTLIFTEQFRYPTYAKGYGWILELPAGVVSVELNPEYSGPNVSGVPSPENRSSEACNNIAISTLPFVLLKSQVKKNDAEIIMSGVVISPT